jgi:hypothetical protein
MDKRMRETTGDVLLAFLLTLLYLATFDMDLDFLGPDSRLGRRTKRTRYPPCDKT